MNTEVLAEMKKLRRLRGGHRADITRRITAVDELISEFDPVQQGEALQSLKQILEDKLEVVREIDKDILDKMSGIDEISDEEIEMEITNATDIVDNVNRRILKIRKLCCEAVKAEVGSLTSAHSDIGNGSHSSRRNHRSARLPKIVINKFEGDPKEWQSWWDTYNSIIHENDDLSPVDKFNYLKTLLTGAALGAGLNK